VTAELDAPTKRLLDAANVNANAAGDRVSRMTIRA